MIISNRWPAAEVLVVGLGRLLDQQSAVVVEDKGFVGTHDRC
jgi:hypothetical protein